MKRLGIWLLAGLAASAVATPLAVASTPAPAGLTMFVVPARYSVLQVMFDVIRQRPAVLVSYQGDSQSERPALHAWNGQEWIPVSMEKYREASFLVNKPDRVVLVGEPTQLPPVLGEASLAWCSRVMTLTELATPSLVNACGKLLDFDPQTWRWFAARYNMELKDVNEQRRRDSWYYRPWGEPSYQVNPRAEPPAPAVEEPAAPASGVTIEPPPEPPAPGSDAGGKAPGESKPATP